jgi:hypothetical protein
VALAGNLYTDTSLMQQLTELGFTDWKMETCYASGKSVPDRQFTGS